MKYTTKKASCHHRVKKIAGKSLLTKILADFLVGFYLLNWVFKHATNHIQTRCEQLKKIEHK
jgi:hypothetical protein